MEVLASDAVIDIPPEVAVCPYCDAKLTATFESWEKQENGIVGTSPVLECETCPDIDSREWDSWLDVHTDMPYVYLLPVCQKVEKWINERYRFDLTDRADLREQTAVEKD